MLLGNDHGVAVPIHEFVAARGDVTEERPLRGSKLALSALESAAERPSGELEDETRQTRRTSAFCASGS